ncbi:hypothetical protein DLI07_24980 [Vibrio parahaemolyticus]|nr:hypothetical protein [Vibrio parahaemolyticus]KIT33060.1 hypothetical protein H323_13490 [Vibrio parahaemolyticus VP766]KIT53689.1 hypothetical protein H334_23055 [Vibrio parahaemolyticus 901128]EGR2774270.1 hypothetical protein [Vibrio parahaemolyticus]EGR2836596.1 hypothetical protein [Vibrio parahaemolyticus]
MGISNRITSHHSLDEAVICKLNNRTVSEKTIKKMVKKIANVSDPQEKLAALKSAFDVAKKIQGKQAREKVTFLLKSNIDLLTQRTSPSTCPERKIAHLNSVAEVGALSKSTGKRVAKWMEDLPLTEEAIKLKQPNLADLPKVTALKGFKGDFNFNRQKIFRNFVSVEPGVLARGSAPHYYKVDSSQKMSADAINFLKGQGFNQVVSLNSIELSHAERSALAKAGIEYIHIKTDDFSAPDREQLLQAVTSMKGKNTYVYCGYGAGRTGTLVSAWQILNNKETLWASTVEKEEQLVMLKDIDKKQAISKSIERLNVWRR